MRKRLFSALAALLASSGLAQGQAYYPVYPSPYPPGYPMPYAAPGYPTGYAAPPIAAPYAPPPGPYAVPPGAMPPGTGRASVSDAPPPVIHGWPPSPGVIPAPASAAPGKGVAAIPTTAGKTAVQPASLPATPAVATKRDGVPATKTSHGKQAAGSCDTCATPTYVPGMPLLCAVDGCGQPLVDRILDEQPRGYHAYARADALYYIIETQNSPILLQLTSIGGRVDVIDAQNLDNGERLAMRTTFGSWVDSCHKVAIEGTVLWFGNRNPRFLAGTPTITRPFLNMAAGGAPALFPVAIPGAINGSAEVSSNFRFWSGELNARHELCRLRCGHIDFLAGFRYANLREDLRVETTSAFVGGYQLTSDRFGAENTFYGGQIGVEFESNYGKCTVNPWAKVAFGYNDEYVTIQGNRVVPDGAGVPRSLDGGFLALPSNIGTYGKGNFIFLPEIGINLGYKIHPNMRLLFGYQGMALTKAARPADQINPALNLTQLPTLAGPGVVVGPLSPLVNGVRDDLFWAHGFNLGMEVRW